MAVIDDPDAVAAMLLDGWSPAGTTRRLQFSRDGAWEDARGVEMPTDAGTARGLLQATGTKGDDVAAEIEWLGHRLVFIGARRGANDGSFADDVARVADREPLDPRAALEALAGGPPRAPEHAELGAANAWKSVGPLRLWDAGGPAPSSSDVPGLLRDRPDLATCVAPVALEVTFAGPRQCWLGIAVSESSREGHVVQERTLAALLDAFARTPRP